MICRELGGTETCTFVEALFSGLSRDGGLFLPVDWPLFSSSDVDALIEMSFVERSVRLTEILLGEEFDREACGQIVREAFDFPLPLSTLDDRTHVLELFHGPTLAFKDFGARFMARAMAHARGIRARGRGLDQCRRISILTATSGDTGSAVARAFFGLAGIEVVVLYPAGRISPIQEKQIATLGGNIHALSVQGSFDDCQALAKAAFRDEPLRREAGLTTANSMNLGRLLPQTFYYFEAVAAVRRVRPGRPLVISVPSGNFGNLTAGILAWKMGLPVARFVAATNANDTVPRCLAGGRFQPGPVSATLSTAMDVSQPNNWPRIEQLFGGDLEAIGERIRAESVMDATTLTTMRSVWERSGYLLDPHSAVGYAALERTMSSHADADGVVLATAHPAKFDEAVRRAIGRPAPISPVLAECMALPLRNRPIEASPDALRRVLREILGFGS